MRTERLFTNKELDVRQLLVDGGSPKLFAPSRIQKCVDEVINRATEFDLKIKDEWTRRFSACISTCSGNRLRQGKHLKQFLVLRLIFSHLVEVGRIFIILLILVALAFDRDGHFIDNTSNLLMAIAEKSQINRMLMISI